MPPDSQKPNYDFINNPKLATSGRRGLPNFFQHASGISLLSLVAVIGIILMVVLFSGSGKSYSGEVDLISRATEIERVSSLVNDQASSQAIKDLAASVEASLTSQQEQLVAYLKKHGKKVDPSKTTTHKNTATDSQMQAAAQSGKLDQTYASYVKSALTPYQNALQDLYKTAPTTERSILADAYNSNKTLLGDL